MFKRRHKRPTHHRFREFLWPRMGWRRLAMYLTLTTVIGKNRGNITNLKFTNRSQDFFEMLIDIEVADVTRLTNIIAALRATPIITSVERARG